MMFEGFPAETVTFFDDIVVNNNKAWFEEKKPFYKKYVQQSAQQFVMALGTRLEAIVPNIRYETQLNGSGSIMRIYRDVRFSKDKTPYKTNLGMVWWEGAGKKTAEPGFYFHLSADEIWFGGGLYMIPDLSRYQKAVDDEVLGAELEAIVAEMNAAGIKVDVHNPYKRVPRGYDKAHPRAEFLKYKGLTTSSAEIDRDVVMSPALVDLCVAHVEKTVALHRWFVKMMQS